MRFWSILNLSYKHHWVICRTGDGSWYIWIQKAVPNLANDKYFQQYRMCVKLLTKTEPCLTSRIWAHVRCKTSNNILLLYLFVQDANDSFVPCMFCFFRWTYCATSLVPKGGNLTYNGTQGRGNLRMSNFPWVVWPPHPGANHSVVALKFILLGPGVWRRNWVPAPWGTGASPVKG